MRGRIFRIWKHGRRTDRLPPFHYATHAVAPLFYLSDSYAKSVIACGSGVMRPELSAQYGNPYPLEHAIIETNKPHLFAEITRSLFHTAISYVEGFTILGEKMSFEWNIENEAPYLHTVKLEWPIHTEQLWKRQGHRHVAGVLSGPCRPSAGTHPKIYPRAYHSRPGQPASVHTARRWAPRFAPAHGSRICQQHHGGTKKRCQ